MQQLKLILLSWEYDKDSMIANLPKDILIYELVEWKEQWDIYSYDDKSIMKEYPCGGPFFSKSSAIEYIASSKTLYSEKTKIFRRKTGIQSLCAIVKSRKLYPKSEKHKG